MGSSGMNEKLSRFVKERYPDSKSDLFAVFMERCGELLHADGEQAMITQHAWMFLSSFERLRAKLLQSDTIVSMAHLGARAFEEIAGEVVQTTAFVLSREHIVGEAGRYARLIEPTTQEGKEQMFLSGRNRYTAQQDNFRKIPGSPVAYWVGERFVEAFERGKLLGTIADPRQGLATTDNNRFVRLWHEIEQAQINFCAHDRDEAQASKNKWFPYNKGGKFRKWYGNAEYIVDYWNDGMEIKASVLHKYPYLKTPDFVVKNQECYFHECISWSKISSGSAAFRFYPSGFIFDVSGCCVFYKRSEELYYNLAFTNSCIAKAVLEAISPTINYETGHIASLPVIHGNAEKQEIAIRLTQENVSISEKDWDSFETSWDFKKHPMI